MQHSDTELLDSSVQIILRAQLARHEGLRLRAYQDTAGVWTIGYGHTPAAEGWEITPREAERLLEQDTEDAIDDAAATFNVCWDRLSQIRRATLVNMAFNLGRDRLGRFYRLWEALAGASYRRAAAEMIDSKWAWQVGRRAFELSYQMMHDRWWR